MKDNTLKQANFQFSLFIPDNSSVGLVNLVCIFNCNLKEIGFDDFKEFCEIRDDVINFMKTEYDGVYLAGDAFQYEYDKKNETTLVEYPLDIKNLLLYEHIEKNKNKLTFTNKKGLETIMTKQAPYKLWTLEALKNECKQRTFDPSTYKDIKDKSILVKLLESVDAEAKTPAPKTPAVEKPVAKKKAPPVPKKKDIKKVEEPNDVDDLDEPELELETEPETPTPKKAPVAKKKVVPPVPKKEVEKKESKPSQAKSNKSALESVVGLNDKLRKAGLWISGCQFLTADQKQALLDAKTEKEKKAVYDELAKKRAIINSTLSEKMKGRAIVKKADGVVESKDNGEVEEVEEVKEVEKPAVKKPVPVPPKKKLPPVPPKTSSKNITNK